MWIFFLSVCTVTRAKNLYVCVCVQVHTHAGCVCLFSNNFHIRLILKGQKLLGSQQWADGGWLNMHLIPFGLVSVSKPPTFLSHNHSYRFSNQFRPQLGLRRLLINSCQLSGLNKYHCGFRRMFGVHTIFSDCLKMAKNGHNVNPTTLF